MKEEGIYRIPGSKKNVDMLRSFYDSGLPVIFADHENPTTVTSLLMRFIREIPGTVFTEEGYTKLQNLRGQQNDAASLMIRDVIMAMPECHRFAVGIMMAHLKRVSSLSQVNKMDALKLATCLFPMVVGPVLIMINSYEDIFGDLPDKVAAIPSMDMVRSVRKLTPSHPDPVGDIADGSTPSASSKRIQRSASDSLILLHTYTLSPKNPDVRRKQLPVRHVSEMRVEHRELKNGHAQLFEMKTEEEAEPHPPPDPAPLPKGRSFCFCFSKSSAVSHGNSSDLVDPLDIQKVDNRDTITSSEQSKRSDSGSRQAASKRANSFHSMFLRQQSRRDGEP